MRYSGYAQFSIPRLSVVPGLVEAKVAAARDRYMVAHRVIGLVLLAVYIYLLFNKGEYLPFLLEIEDAKHMNGDAGQGYDFIVTLPLVGMACLIMPGTFADLFPWRVGLWNRNLLTPGFYVMVGYYCLLVSAGLLWIMTWERF
jgi:hypothetical protein